MPDLNDELLDLDDLEPDERTLILGWRAMNPEERHLFIRAADALIIEEQSPDAVVAGFKEELTKLRSARRRTPPGDAYRA